MNENVRMKRISVIFAILALFCSSPANTVFSAETEEILQAVSQEEEMFAPVDLDLTDYTKMNEENKKNKKFKLTVEKEGKPSYVKNSGQIWDEDMLFRHTYFSDQTNLRVIPSYGSLGSYITRELDTNTTVMVGQDGISKINGDTVNFAYSNSSYYSSGARIEGKEKHFNYSAGAFTETDTLNQELAAIVSTKPKHILKSKGTFYAGGGVFTNLMNDVNKNTSGVFAQYNNNKLSFGAQMARSSYSKSGYNESNTAHFLTSYRFNNHLALKNKIVKNFDVDEIQGELGVTYNPLKDTDRLQLEVTAANYQSQNVITRQRLKFSTSFKF